MKFRSFADYVAYIVDGEIKPDGNKTATYGMVAANCGAPTLGELGDANDHRSVTGTADDPRDLLKGSI
jgi:hypothetical protein